MRVVELDAPHQDVNKAFIPGYWIFRVCVSGAATWPCVTFKPLVTLSCDERRDCQKTVCYALGLTTCAPGIGVLVLLSVLVGAIFLKAPSAVRRKPARTLKEVAETPLLLYWLYLRGHWASGRMESINHSACLLKKGRWGGVLGNCRSIKLQFLEKSERNNSTVCKQLGHNTGISNTQSGLLRTNGTLPVTFASATAVREMIITVIIVITMSCIL